MASKPIIDVSQIDTSSVAVSRDEIYKVNPHRHEFMQLDGINFIDHDKKVIAGYRDVREDEFWVRGHIPGRPLFPGVLMIEAAAQMCSAYYKFVQKDERFLGFGGVDRVKFRGQVVPGDRLILLGRVAELRSRRAVFDTQGVLEDGAGGFKVVFEGRITGMPI